MTNSKNYQIIQPKINNDSKNEVNEKNFKIKVKKNLNNKVVADKSKDKDNLRNKNLNHKYIESTNIKNNKKFQKNQHSFNNLLLPVQKVLKI